MDKKKQEMTQGIIDVSVSPEVKSPEGYRYGPILSSAVEESQKSFQGRRMVRERILTKGKDSIYNMTGLVRAFPLDPEDLPGLENQFTFYAYFMGAAEEQAIQHMGGNSDQHGAVICNRVTSSMLAIMLALLERGDRVLSVVQDGRSHPSVQQAVELAGCEFREVIGINALEKAIVLDTWKMLIVTPLTPSKYHIPASAVRRAVELAKERDILVFSDDAHMISRCVFYKEEPTFAIGDIDVAVWSIDKHVPGPRGAAIVAKHDLMDRIQAQVFQFGLEAQTGHYVAMLRGMEMLDTRPVEEASRLAREAFQRFRRRYGKRVYQAGPGVAISHIEFAEIVMARVARPETALTAAEIAISASFLLLRDYGIVTIPITGYPGAAPTFRLMMHPDGAKFGLDCLEEAVEGVIQTTASMIQDTEAIRSLLLGK